MRIFFSGNNSTFAALGFQAAAVRSRPSSTKFSRRQKKASSVEILVTNRVHEWESGLTDLPRSGTRPRGQSRRRPAAAVVPRLEAEFPAEETLLADAVSAPNRCRAGLMGVGRGVGGVLM